MPRKSLGSVLPRLLAVFTVFGWLSAACGQTAPPERPSPRSSPGPTEARVVLMRLAASGETFAASAGRTLRRPFSSTYRLEWVEAATAAAADPMVEAGAAEPTPGEAGDATEAAVWRCFILATRNLTLADSPPVVTNLPEARRTVLVPRRSAAAADGRAAARSEKTDPARIDPRLPMSPAGPLTAEELDLVCVPFDPLVLDAIVAWQAAAPAEARTRLPQDMLPVLVGFDTVEADPAVAQDARSSLPPPGDADASRGGGSPTSGILVERLPGNDPSAPPRIGLRGVVSGAVRGASSRIGVDGVLELEPSGTTLASAVLHVRERREAGFTAPGFESDATVVLTCRSAGSPLAHTAVGDAVSRLEEARRGPQPEDDRLAWSDPGGTYRLRYDPRWTPVAAGRSLRMRLVDDGALVAEATITPLTGAGATDLEHLREDVRLALGERFVGFDASEERRLPDGSRFLRVVVAAESGSRRFRESHFVIAAPVPAGPAAADADQPPAGVRLAIAVVVDGSLLARLREADLRLVEGITLEREQAGQPGAAGTSLDGRGDPLK